MKSEIERIVRLMSKVDEVEIENDMEEIKNAGFKTYDDYKFIKHIKERFNNFLTYVEKSDGLDERIPFIQKTFAYIYLLEKENK